MSKHSAHRPPHKTRSSFGVVYPDNDIVSVIADSAAAERRVQELRAAGIPDDDIDLATGEQVLGFERHRAHSQVCSAPRQKACCRGTVSLVSESVRPADPADRPTIPAARETPAATPRRIARRPRMLDPPIRAPRVLGVDDVALRRGRGVRRLRHAADRCGGRSPGRTRCNRCRRSLPPLGTLQRGS
jgi:hypothetical protein